MNRLYAMSGRALLVIALVCANNAGASEELFSLSLEQLVEIEITSASKASNAVRDIPASVTILTRDDISLMGYTTLEELLIHVPGFYHIDSYEDYQIGVRGSVGGALAFLVNGVQLHPTRIKDLSVPDRSRTNIPIESIDRVEIVRGPSSVIYGNNAFFGSINIVTNDIESKAGLMAAGAGNNGAGKVFARIGQESDEGFTVFNLGYTQSGGIAGEFADYMSAAQLGDMEPGMLQQLDGTLAHENLSTELSGKYRSLEYNLRYSNMEYGFYAFSPGYDTGPQISLSNWHGSLEYTHSIHQELDASYSFVASHENYLAMPDFFVPNIRGNQYQSSDRVELEALLSEESYDRLQWVAGLNLKRVSTASNRADLPDLPFFEYKTLDDVDSRALFFNLDYALSSSVSLVGGYRYTYLGSYNVQREILEGEEIEHSVVEKDSRTDDAFRLSAAWTINHSNLLKLIYGSATQDNRWLELPEPEFIESLELNYLYMGKNNTLSLSLFQNDIDNIASRTVRLGESGNVKKNESESEWLTQGAELIFTARPSGRLSAEFSAVYQDTEDKGLGGIKIAYSPQCLMKLKLGYGFAAWAVSASYAYVDEMLAGYSVDYTVEPYELEYDGEAVDAYELLGLNLRYQKPEKNWYLNIHAFNLLDSEIRYPANELADFKFGAPGPGGQLFLTVGYEL